MSDDPRLVRALVACYPARWRRRYGDEYAQLLRDLHVHRRPALIVDSLAGAARAYRGVLMSSDSPLTLAVWAAGLFTVGGLGFAKLAEDFRATAHGAYVLLVIASAVALLALLATAAPSAVALLRGRDNGAWKYVAVPVAGAVIWFGGLRLALTISAGHGVRTAPTVTGFVILAAAGTAVVAATAWSATRVLRRVPVARRARLRRASIITVAAGMVVATMAALIWGLRIRVADAIGFRGDDGLAATPFVLSWIVVLAALGGASVLAVLAARRRPVS